MVHKRIIRPSSSPWCAPAVYVPKPIGEVCICVDFVQLNCCTKKDSHPVHRADRPHQRLACKRIFSKLDLRSAYWQFLMHQSSIEMPYGLTGATQTCQRGLDEIFHECHDCVDNYVDDIIVSQMIWILTSGTYSMFSRSSNQQASHFRAPMSPGPTFHHTSWFSLLSQMSNTIRG